MSLRQCRFLDKYEVCVTNNYCFILYNWQRKEAVVAPVTVESSKWFGLKEEFGGRRDFCLTALSAYLKKDSQPNTSTFAQIQGLKTEGSPIYNISYEQTHHTVLVKC